MHYYPFSIGDYARDTAHLSIIEHGIYRLLIDWCYLNEKSITTEKAMKIGREYPKETQSVLSEFFLETETKEGGKAWSHRRIDAELDKYHSKAETNRKNGALGGRPKTQNNPNGYRTLTDSHPKHNPNQEPITNNQEPSIHVTAKAVTSRNAKRSDPIPYQKIVDLYHETLPMLPKVVALTTTRKANIRGRYANNDVDELEDWKGFFEKVGRSKFLTGRVAPVNGRKPFLADLEWLTKEGNFMKILEGKYS